MNCKSCGAKIQEGDSFCKYCGTPLNKEEKILDSNIEFVQKPSNNSSKENIGKGILGSIIGSLVGAVIIIILSRIGFVASVAGLAMAYCTFYLYEKFAGSISKKGIIICIIVMIVMTFLAENMAVSMDISNELSKLGYKSFDTMYVFTNFFSLLEEGVIDSGTYAINLLMVYVFNAIGAFGIIKTKLNNVK